MGLSISTDTWEGSRSSQVQILMSLNHLTHGSFWSFSCLINCTVLGVFHSLKDHLWKYLMSIMGLMSLPWILQPPHGLRLLQFSLELLFLSWVSAGLCSPVAPPGWLLAHPWLCCWPSMDTRPPHPALLVSASWWGPGMVGCDLLLLHLCSEWMKVSNYFYTLHLKKF